MGGRAGGGARGASGFARTGAFGQEVLSRFMAMAKANGDKITESQMKKSINANWGVFANLQDAGGKFWNGRSPEQSWESAYKFAESTATAKYTPLKPKAPKVSVGKYHAANQTTISLGLVEGKPNVVRWIGANGKTKMKQNFATVEEATKFANLLDKYGSKNLGKVWDKM